MVSDSLWRVEQWGGEPMQLTAVACGDREIEPAAKRFAPRDRDGAHGGQPLVDAVLERAGTDDREDHLDPSVFFEYGEDVRQAGEGRVALHYTQDRAGGA